MAVDKSVLVIDDESSICLAFQRFFERRDWQVFSAASAAEGLKVYSQARPPVVFLDLRLPDRNGLDLLPELKAGGAGVIVITAFGDLETVVRAIRGQACEYLLKPVDLDMAMILAQRIQRNQAVEDRNADESPQACSFLIGQSTPMQDVYKMIARAADSTFPVLICGETGTGKELAARAIHQFSSRRDGPFVALNCGAIPESLIESELFGHIRGSFTGADADRTGRFESANGGSLLLDEVGDLPLPVQVKLLRVLDTGTVERVGSTQPLRLDVRILAATNKDIREEVRCGRFRQDLYFRLAVLQIAMPPLRDRRTDIPLLVDHFLSKKTADQQSAASRMDELAMHSMMQYDWPGNVRELRNAVQYATAVAPGRAIVTDDLPEFVRDRQQTPLTEGDRLAQAALEYAAGIDSSTDRFRLAIAQVERTLIADALDRCNGNQSEAADYLGLHRNTLRNKLRDFADDQAKSEAGKRRL